MKRGILETVASIVCMSCLTAYFRNLWLLLIMGVLVILFLGFGGEEDD